MRIQYRSHGQVLDRNSGLEDDKTSLGKHVLNAVRAELIKRQRSTEGERNDRFQFGLSVRSVESGRFAPVL